MRVAQPFHVDAARELPLLDLPQARDSDLAPRPAVAVLGWSARETATALGTTLA